MTDLFLDTLDIKRQEIFFRLKSFSDIGALGGGTAIALQVGHRRSFDFAISTNDTLPTTLWSKVRRVFGTGCVKAMEIEGQLNFLTPDNISITFFHDDYPFIFPTLPTETIDLANLKDLASNKAFVIGRRGKWRDYVDLYFLLTEKYITLKEIITISLKRSQEEFPIRLFLQQLSYFDDLGNFAIDFMKDEIDPGTIKEYLVNAVKEFKTTL